MTVRGMRLTAACVARVVKKKHNLSIAASVSAIRGHTEFQKNPGWHSKPQEGARIDDRFTHEGVQAELDSFQEAADAAPFHANGIPGATDNGVESLRDHVAAQGQLRQEGFKDQTRWLGNINEKLHPKSPDVKRHKSSKSRRWIDCWSNSQCMTEALERNVSVKKSDAGTSDSGRSSAGEERGTGGSFAANRTTIPRQHYVVSQTALMSQHVKCGKGRQALRIYKEMQQVGLIFSSYTYVAALQACSSLKDLKSAKQIHAEVVESGLELDVYVGTMLVDVYGKCGSLVEARGVFDKMHRRSVVSWNSMISGYAQMEQCDEAVKLYEQMQQEGVIPNDRTFVAVLKACSSSLASSEHANNAHGMLVKQRCLDQVRAIHSLALTSGFESDIFVGTMLVDVYAKCGSLVDARHVFGRMSLRSVVTWTAIILGYSQMGEGKEALQLFAQMQKEGVVPDDRTFVGALKACSSLAASEEGNEADRNCTKTWCLEQIRAIHAQVVRSGCEDIFVGNIMVDAYIKCGSLVDARDVFDKMSHRNVVSWTTMILGYALLDKGDVALQLYARMQQEGVEPNERTFIGALKACGSMALLEKGKEIHAQISKTRLEDTDSFVASGLIDMYCKCGSMDDAQQVFDASGSRDVVAWNALITGYARQGQSQHVFDSFEVMRQKGIHPDSFTFLGLLTLCSHVGLVDKGQSYFDSMARDFGLIPSVEHYNCMIDLLGRAGQLGKAMKMVKTMPVPPPGEVWRSLLGACRKWKNVELGRTAFECVMRLDKADPAAFVLLSSIYAGAHMLTEAQEVQSKRLRSQAWKQPGLSWLTDTGGLPHTFVVGDREHSESLCIYANLRDLCVQMGEVKLVNATP